MTPSLDAGSEVVDRIIAAAAPVLFLDTASILDVARVPVREDLNLDILVRAAQLSGSLETRSAWLLTTPNVIREFNSNRSDVEAELRGGLARKLKEIDRIRSIERILFPGVPRPVNRPEEQSIATLAIDTMDGLVRHVELFEGSDRCSLNAAERVWACLPPSSTTKQEFKDCVIFEEFLELAAALRKSGFGGKIVFVTPNKKDFGPVPYGHARIAQDITRHQADYASDLAHASSIAEIAYPVEPAMRN